MSYMVSSTNKQLFFLMIPPINGRFKLNFDGYKVESNCDDIIIKDGCL